MTTKHLSALFTRDLNRLKSEINGYDQEQSLWIVATGITNSGGNLCLHLVGNLNAFIGAELGNTKYIRDREAEFNSKNIPRLSLIKRIDDLIETLITVFESLTQSKLDAIYPKELFGFPMTTEYFLLHLYGHLNYHLGQINYHRRLVEGSNTTL